MSEIGAEKENLAGIRLMAAVAAVLLIFSVAVLCIQAIAFDHDFYKNEYKKMNTCLLYTSERRKKTDASGGQRRGAVRGVHERFEDG